MGVGGCEIKTIGYTCRSVVLKVFGPGFNSRRLHQTSLALPRAGFLYVPAPLLRSIVIVGAGYNLPVVLFSQLSFLPLFSPQLRPMNGSCEIGRLSDTSICAKTVVRAGHYAAQQA